MDDQIRPSAGSAGGGRADVSEADLDFIDSTDESYARDPHPVLAAARERRPLARSPYGWEVLRYDDVLALLGDQRLRPAGLEMLHNQGITEGPLHDWWELLMFHHEPPTHTRLRTLVSRALTPRRVETFRPRLTAIAATYVDRLIDAGEADLVAELAHLVPIVATCEMLGIPTEAHEDFGEWTVTLGRGFSPNLTAETRREVEAALVNLNSYVSELIDERHRQPRDDLLQGLIDAEDGCDRLSHDELMALVVDLLFSGHDTSKSLLSIGAWLLVSHPDQLALLRTRADLLASFVDEVLRFESPILATPRDALADIEVGGITLSAGSVVNLSIASGNRDPRRFDEPDRFDVTRAANRHLSFGHGIHFCIGASFARAEAQETFRVLLERTASIEAIDPEPQWAPLEGIRRLKRLPVRVTAR